MHNVVLKGATIIQKIWLMRVLGAMTLVLLVSNCGEDPKGYQDETLTYETPVSAKKVNQKKHQDLDLGADDAANFHFRRIGAYVPWDPYPIWDYFLDPVPVPIPVAPGLDLVDYVHPFYAYASMFYPWGDDD